MSKEGMESFFKFMTENKECRDKVKSLGDDFVALAAYARELGYEFTTEELRNFQDKAQELLKNKVLKFRPPDAVKSPGERAFYDLMKLAETDGAVAKELAALDMGSPEEVIAYGREKGLIFTGQDIKAVGKEMLGQEDELSDEELEAAAGGTAVVLTVMFVAGALGLGLGGIAAAMGLSEVF